MTDPSDDANDSESNAPDAEYPSWSIALPGLSEKRARAIVRLLERDGLAYGAEAISPDKVFDGGLDRAGAQWLRAALNDEPMTVINERGDALIKVTREQARESLLAFISDLDEFLATGRKYDVEENGG